MILPKLGARPVGLRTSVSSSLLPKPGSRPVRPFKPRFKAGKLPSAKGKIVASPQKPRSKPVTPGRGSGMLISAHSSSTGHLLIPSGKFTATPKATAAHLPRASGKLVPKVKPAPKETAFKPYTVPKLSKPRDLPLPQYTMTLAMPTKTTPSLVLDNNWSLRNYDGMQCMVITLSVSECTVTVRTSEVSE